MIGDCTVGKTSIVQQFINSGTCFPKNYSMTLGGDVQSRTINIPDTSDAVELVMIDCSGRSVYNDMMGRLWEGCSLVVVVYDVTREETQLALQYFQCNAKDNAGVEEPFFYLANEYHKLFSEQANTMAHIA